MPWHVGTSSKCSVAEPWAVIKDADSSVVACHASKEKAQKQVAALYANEPSGGSYSMTDFTPRRENLVRAVFPGAEFRDDEGPVLHGHFARFNEWNLIDSAIEGRFLERIAPGAFTKTLAEKTPKVLFQHGKDPELGDKPIAVPRSVAEDDIGPAYDAPLLDGIPPLIVAGLRAGAYGSSYRFSIPKGKDDWNRTPAKTDYNPEGIPERTIREAQVFEFGPVTFPADTGATASVRSLTDEYAFDTLTSDPAKLAALIEAKSQALPATEPTPVTPPVSRATPPATTSPEGKEPSVETKNLTPDEKASRLTELKSSLREQAEATTGVRSVEAQARWDADNLEHDKLVADLAVIEQGRARLQVIGGDEKRVEAPFAMPNVTRTRTVEDIYNPDQFTGIGYRTVEERDETIRGNALRSLESTRLSGKGVDNLAFAIENTGTDERGLPEIAARMLATGSPVYKRGFAKYLRSGNDHMLSNEERAAMAVVGTTTTGGYAVPYVFDPTIIRLGVWTAQNPFRAACRTEVITAGNNWRTVTVGAITAAYATEAAAASEGGPTWGQPTYTVQRAQAFVTVSIESLEDRADVTSELTAVFAEGKDTLEENQFAIGVGTTVYPLGMFTDTAYTNKDTATNDVTAIADIQALEGDLPLRFRANGAFFMNRSTIRQLQALDTTYRYFSGAGIQYPGQQNIVYTSGGNTGLNLLNYPVWEVPSAVSTLTTDGAIIVVFCDPKSYIIVDRIGMNVEVIPNMLNGATPSFPTGQRGIFAYWRNTARPVAADAGRSLSVQ